MSGCLPISASSWEPPAYGRYLLSLVQVSPLASYPLFLGEEVGLGGDDGPFVTLEDSQEDWRRYTLEKHTFRVDRGF